MEENWIQIYESDEYEKTNEPIWLEQILIDNNIPYNSKIKEYWIGIRLPKYKKRLKIFVQKKHESTVKKYIEDFEDSKSIIKENVEELKNINGNENDIEIKRHNRIKKVGVILWLVSFLIVIIFGIIGIIMTNI